MHIPKSFLSAKKKKNLRKIKYREYITQDREQNNMEKEDKKEKAKPRPTAWSYTYNYDKEV